MSGIRDHIIDVGEWGVRLAYTPLVQDLLAKRRIFVNGASPHCLISIGRNVALEPYIHLFPTFCSMGSFSFAQTPLLRKIIVGRYCSIGANLQVFGGAHPYYWATSSSMTYDNGVYNIPPDVLTGPLFTAVEQDFHKGNFTYGKLTKPNEPPVIGNDVWIGQNVQFAANITVGTGSVIGAGAVVTKDVPPYTIVGGVPAKNIRPRFDEKIIDGLLKSGWWRYDPRVLEYCDYQNPEKFLNDFADMEAKGILQPFEPAKINYQDILNDIMSNA